MARLKTTAYRQEMKKPLDEVKHLVANNNSMQIMSYEVGKGHKRRINMSQVEAQDNQLEKYGLSKEKLQTLALVTESLALAEYMNASLTHFMEDGIEKQTYILGSFQCFNLLIDKLSSISLSLSVVLTVFNRKCIYDLHLG